MSQPIEHDPVVAALSAVLADLEAVSAQASLRDVAERSREPADPAARAAASARLLALIDAIAVVERHRFRHRGEAVRRLALEHDRAATPPRRHPRGGEHRR